MGTPWDAHSYDRTSGPQQGVQLPLDYVRLNVSAVRAA